LAKFIVKYWENEEAREEGLSEIFSANLEILDVAIEQAKRLFFSQDFPCVEVEDEDEKSMFHISVDCPSGERFYY
jgi:hypothetical protein